MDYIEQWARMTDAEISEHKNNVCVKCHYYSFGSGGNNEPSRRYGLCDYILIEGHSRGCSPFECVEKGIFVRKSRGRKKKGMRVRKV